MAHTLGSSSSVRLVTPSTRQFGSRDHFDWQPRYCFRIVLLHVKEIPPYALYGVSFRGRFIYSRIDPS